MGIESLLLDVDLDFDKLSHSCVFNLYRKERGMDYIFGKFVGGLGKRFGLSEESIGISIDLVLPPFFIDLIDTHVEELVVGSSIDFSITYDNNDYIVFVYKYLKYNFENLLIEVVDVTGSNGRERFVDDNSIYYYDSLTGLISKEQLFSDLSEEVESKDYDGFLGILFVDIDDFKEVNDNYGHLPGDELLIDFSERLKSSVRDGDIVSRYGGDEFLIVCKNLRDEQSLRKVAERVIDSITGRTFTLSDGEIEVSISVSVGVAVFPRDGDTLEIVVDNADMAMYRAKNAGKNRYCFFEENMRLENLRHEELKNELINSLERDELDVVYLPIHDVSEGRVVGLEALLRWNHSEKGLLHPGEFLHVVEDTTLMIKIGYWLLDRSLRDLKEIHSNYRDDIYMSLNLSNIQFNESSLVSTIKKSLDRYRIHSTYLMVELPSVSVMSNVDDVSSTIAIIKRLREVGVQVSVDNFGKSSVSIYHLSRVDISNIKIDRSFISMLSDDVEDKATIALIKTTLDYGRNTGIGIVAEGVENEVQLTKLMEMGCTLFQGFYFNRPLYIDQLEDILVT